MQLLIVGATGLVGSQVLQQALADSRITRVVAPVRRALPAHPRLLAPLVDFEHLPEDADWWRAVDGDPLPRIALAPLDGGDISDYPLPANKEELWAMLEGGVK